MATLDLSRFDVNVRQDNRQRQVFSNEGEEVFNSLAKIGKTVADYSTEIVAKNRLREHADYQTKVATSIAEAEAKFDTEWAINAKAGRIKDAQGLTYLESKNKFLKTAIDEAKVGAPDEGLFYAYSNTLEKYRSQSTVDAIKKNYELGVEASTFKWKDQAEKSGKEFALLESGSYNNYYKKKQLEWDALYAETSLLSQSIADKNIKELKQGVAKIILDKSMNVDFKRTPLIQAVNEIMPLEVFLSKDRSRATIQFLKDLKENGTEEEYNEAVKSHKDVMKANIALAKDNLEKNYSAPNSSITPEVKKSTEEKLNAMSALLELEDMDIEADFHPQESKAISRGNADIWDHASAEQQLNYYEKILDWKVKSTNNSKANINYLIEQWKHLPSDIGTSTMSFSGYLKATEGPDRIAGIIRDNSELIKDESAVYTGKLYDAIMDKLVMDNAFSPGVMQSKGWDAVALHKKAIEQMKSYNIDIVNEGLSTGAIGIKTTAEYHIKQLENFRKMRAIAVKDPARAMYLVGSSKLLKAADDVLASGTFNSSAYKKYEALANGEMHHFTDSIHRANMDKAITAPLVATLKNEIDTMRARGDDNYDLLVNSVLGPMEPNTRATVLERLMQGDNNDRTVGRSIIFKVMHGSKENSAMVNEVLAANTESEIKDTNDLKASDSMYKSRTDKASSEVTRLLNKFYDHGKGAINPESVSASGGALLNYVNKELRRNPTGDPAEITRRAFDSFYKDKIAIGTDSMRGTIKLNEGENQSQLEARAASELYRFKSELFKGKMQINVDGMPLTDKMIKSGVNFKTIEGFNKFMDAGYKLQFQTIDDSGRGREVMPVFVDEKTGVKYHIRDANKRLIRRSIP